MTTDFRADWTISKVGGLRQSCPAVAASVAHLRATCLPGRGRTGSSHRDHVQDELWVLIADDGCGPHTPPAEPGLGLGVGLMTEVCDSFVLSERVHGGTEARMRFVIGPGAAAPVLVDQAAGPRPGQW